MHGTLANLRHERFAQALRLTSMSALLGPVALPKDVAVLFSPMDDSATCFIDPNARFGALVPCPLISIHGVDVPIRALLEKHYQSAFGPEDIWRQHSQWRS